MTNEYVNIKNQISTAISFASEKFLQLEKTVNEFSNYGASLVDGPLEFAVSRIPNTKEVLTNSMMQSIVDSAVGDLKNAFGDNPTARTVLRDWSKIPSVSANVYGNNTISSTGIKYSEGNLYSGQVKAACKTLGLTVFSMYEAFTLKSGETSSFGTAARVLNGVCEYPAIVIKNAARDQQLYEKANPFESRQEFWDFFSNNAKYLASVPETIVKFFVSDYSGEKVKKLGYDKVIKSALFEIDNYVALSLFSFSNENQLKQSDSIYTKFYKYAVTAGVEGISGFTLPMKEINTNTFKSIFNLGAAFPKLGLTVSKFAIGASEAALSHYASLFFTSIVDTTLLTSISKVAQDTTGLFAISAIEYYENFDFNKVLGLATVNDEL